MVRHSIVTQVFQLTRYGIVGAALFLVDIGLFAFLSAVAGVGVAVSQVVSRSTGAVLGFVAHRQFTFAPQSRTHDWPLTTQGFAYVAVTVSLLVISPFLVLGSIALLNGRVMIGKLLSDLLLILVSYVSMRFIFRSRPR